jgi:ribonuclease HI
MNYAFVDGSVDCTRKRSEGGANYGGVCAVVLRGEPVLRQAEKDLVSEPHFTGFTIVGELFTAESKTVEIITNNTMELSAVRLAAEVLQEKISAGEQVSIWTDSQYAQGCLRYDTNWSPKENIPLIIDIRKLVAKPNVRIHHIRGHRKLAWNELVDLGAKKCVELHETRAGFRGDREIDVCSQCFRCMRFACKDPHFGTRSSSLRHKYGKPPCEGRRFRALPAGLAENLQWK